MNTRLRGRNASGIDNHFRKSAYLPYMYSKWYMLQRSNGAHDMTLERNVTALEKRSARPRRRRAPYDVATLCTLDVGQVLAVAGMVTGEKPRITLRDILLLRLRDILRAEGAGGSAEEDATCIAADLASAPFAGSYGGLLRTVVDLSRDRKPPAAPHICKILRKIESTAAVSATYTPSP